MINSSREILNVARQIAFKFAGFCSMPVREGGLTKANGLREIFNSPFEVPFALSGQAAVIVARCVLIEDNGTKVPF